MGHKRVCTINDGGSMVQWPSDWHSVDLYSEMQDTIENEISNIG